MKWIWEKTLFDMLRKIKTFRLFRKQKTFRCWKINIRESKQSKTREMLRRRLFSANEVLQSVLLHVRMLCERASGSKDGAGIDEHEIIMIKYDPNGTLNLDEFKRSQDIQIDIAYNKLKGVKEEIMNLAYVSCIVLFNFFFVSTKLFILYFSIIDCWRA